MKNLRIMGILNVTPDSFSDGGRFNTIEAALEQAERMIDEGADIIDIGGESTRPGAADVSTADEYQRVIPILKSIKARYRIQVSIDTSKAEIMRAAIDEGADIINDVRALQNPGAIDACRQHQGQICLMHMQGQPRTMQSNPQYDHVIDEVKQFLQQRINACEQAGINKHQIIVDPGFGFGKTLEHNLQLLSKLSSFQSLQCPILAGISRKSMIGQLLDNAPTEERLYGSLSAAVIAAMNGASIIRVHDVKATADALKIVSAVHNNRI